MGGVLNGEEKSFRHVTMVAKFQNLHELLTMQMPLFQERLLKIQKFCYYGNMTSHYPTIGQSENVSLIWTHCAEVRKFFQLQL